MYLKSLSMRGFKSFADKTIIEFDPLGGITAIVGPNGCGKSNLVDAVRWVLGEQNPKELRSSALEDVIFAGSTQRKPLSLAEVTITLDNSDNKIRSEFSEIAIRRRTFRSGESEFQINKTDCRLKDIRDLFLDTGLGSGSYSIINQGQVDEILSSKPEDRRRVFEEAARINKYKFRKKAAERKLISTEQNLLRISDLKGEIANQLSTLSVQAEKAKQFNQLKEALKCLEIGTGKRQLKNCSDRKDNISSKISELKKLSSQNFDTASKIESEKTRNKHKLTEIEREIENLRLEIGQTKLAYEESKSSILLNKEKGRHLEEKLSTIKDELGTLLPQLKSLKSSLASKKEEEVSSREKLATAEKELRIIEAEISRYNTEQSKVTEELENIKAEIFNCENSIIEERNKLVELQGNMRFVREESRRDSELLVKLEEESKAFTLELDQLLGKTSSIKDQAKANRDKINGMAALIKNKQEEYAKIQELFMQKKESFDVKSSKYALWIELQKTHEEYPKGTKEALKIGEKKVFGTVYGTVADQIKVDPEHETAISIALSSRIMDIIVDSDETAQSIIKYLKDNNLGRATFIPLNLIDERESAEKLPRFKGVIDFAYNLVKTDKRFSKAIKYLLANTIVMDNLKNAIEVAKKKLPIRIVTLEGEFIPNYATLMGGSPQKAGALLGREREILSLEEELKILKSQLSLLRQTMDGLSSDVSAKEKELKDLFEADARLNIEAAKLDQSCQVLKDRSNSAKEEIEMIRSSVNARSGEAEEVENKKQAINSIIVDLENRLQEMNKNLRIKQEGLRTAEQGKSKVSEDLINLRVGFSNAETSSNHVLEEISRIETNIKSLESITNAKNEADIGRQLEETKNNIIKLENSLPKMEEAEKDLSHKLESLQIEKGTTQKEIEHQEEILRSEAGRELDVRDSISKEEINLAKIESEIAAIEQRMIEDYNLTLEQILNSEHEITNVTQTKDEINSLRQNINELGPVNPLAIEEYDKAKDRISFIEGQYSDLIIARENLSNLIKELDSKAKIEFLNTIKTVNEHFSEIFATLFEGGEAKITLTGDENILDSGIDIVAKPGGKKWLSLSVMSGGERALTAIALLFALLRTHPSPFCFLDEVDAALDEANIHRFTRLLKDFSRSTQIILITHNKQTMTMADTLYGITMEEPGISKVVSVKLSKVAA